MPKRNWTTSPQRFGVFPLSTIFSVFSICSSPFAGTFHNFCISFLCGTSFGHPVRRVLNLVSGPYSCWDWDKLAVATPVCAIGSSNLVKFKGSIGPGNHNRAHTLDKNGSFQWSVENWIPSASNYKDFALKRSPGGSPRNTIGYTRPNS